VIELADGPLRVTIDPLGAQLRSLRLDGVPYLYEGDSPFWPKSAPILFPVVGRCTGDLFLGRPMPRHGFARDLLWKVGGRGGEFELVSSERTRAHYPFDFALRARYAVEGTTLDCRYEVENRGEVEMPFSFGLHPAFRWPLGDGPRDGWVVRFPRALDTERVFLEEGLRGERREPVRGTTIALSDALFADDALVLRDPGTTAMVLESPHSPRKVVLDHSPVSWLGLWSIPRAPFICLEPWQGVAGKRDESSKKEGLLALPARGRWGFQLTIRCC